MTGGDIEQDNLLRVYSEEMTTELARILSFWERIVVDETEGGFHGKVRHDNDIVQGAPKGAVLNSRILWAFSAAYNLTGNTMYLSLAHRAFDYISEYFIDKEHGGVFWTVDNTGQPLDTKKQTYAIAFAIYGLAEFYKATNNEKALAAAVSMYKSITEHALDKKVGGYFEAFGRDWTELNDFRLSSKDANEKKSMNTHLHIIEGFSNLYCIWPREELRVKIEDLLVLFQDHIINRETNHLNLFFADDWTVRSSLISYGHDIEAAWLLQETAEIINNKKYIKIFRDWALKLTGAAAEGLDDDGGLWYEYEPGQRHLHREKHSWPQAEAMVGFFNSWQITRDASALNNSVRSWKFIKDYIMDVSGGEWVWGVYENYSVMNSEDKAGLWKCPYHNSRACIEIIKRINCFI